MNILISRREVLNNIIRFKDKLLAQKEEREEEIREKRFYRALLQRKTGDIRFLEDAVSTSPSEEWQEIRIDVETFENEPAHFVISDKKNQPLGPEGLAPLAWRIIAETVETLNLIASQHPPKDSDILPEEAALEDLSEIHLSEIAGTIEETAGWKGNIDQFTAEKMLKNQQVGTYLLRQGDEFAQGFANGLSQSNHTAVKPYLIAIKDVEEKVASKLILQTERGWTLYRGNPDLRDSEYQYFISLQEAIRRLEPRAQKPLRD